MLVYKNSDMLLAIGEYVHNAQYREVLRLRLCEGYTYEQIGELCRFSPQHVKRICKTYSELLMSCL